ncbi:aldo/keto reductase [Nocardia sp. R7R-8]|uniref:aldo/keto reductase n=1 Tax=Nocardia sp. R7R-8 TaxID=3459304 RepID=UPI00403DC918
MTSRYPCRTGVLVSPLTLAAMNFGAWANRDQDDAAKIIHRALDAGINVVDTADVDCQGENEEIVGKALRGCRDDVVLAGKFHGQIGTDPNSRGDSRRWIIRAVDDSLRRLGTDHLVLYQGHRPESVSTLEETVAALDDLVCSGKIPITAPRCPSGELVEAQWIADSREVNRAAAAQVPYPLLIRGIERETLPIARRYGLGALTYGPLAASWPSGQYRRSAATVAPRRPDPGQVRHRITRARFPARIWPE